ncbi:MAG: hypothetical protein GWP09_02645, partial [Nitrospiraceae bacterium]|nr:hypothetical protein [Nitrospiraceae bacterium]
MRDCINVIYSVVFNKKKPDNFGRYITNFWNFSDEEVVNYGSSVSSDIFTWFPVVNVNKVIRRDNSHLDAIANVSEKDVEASSREGSSIDYSISFEKESFGHKYVKERLESRLMIPRYKKAR